MPKSLAEIRLQTFADKWNKLYQEQQLFFNTDKQKFPEKRKRHLNESKKLEAELNAYVKQLKFEGLIDKK